MVIGVIIVAMAVWTAAIFALQAIQGYPSIAELAAEGARARNVWWAIWLVGMVIGIAFIVVVRRFGRNASPR
jgi:dipeptide/tripeptide permease